MICLYSKNICYYVFITNQFHDFFLEYVELQKNQNMLQSYYLYAMPPNEFQYHDIHQD